MNCAKYAIQDGDVGNCNRLVQTLTGTEAAAAIRWIERNVPAVWVEAEKKFKFQKSKRLQELDETALMSDLWYESEKSKGKQIWDTHNKLLELETYLDRAATSFRKHDPDIAQFIENAAMYLREQLEMAGYKSPNF